MPQFHVDEDVAALVENLAQPKPFENLTFNAALRRVLAGVVAASPKATKAAKPDPELDQLLAESTELARARAALKSGAKKVPSPSAAQWAATVPELKSKRGLESWKAICDFLKIETGGDSARRKLKHWVKANRPAWPAVPDLE